MSLKLSGSRPIKPVFSDEELDRIKGDNPPLDVAMRYGLQPKRAGTGIHTALCPFHAEKTGSFTIYGDHFHCFGCGWSGDVIRFTQCIEEIGFRTACERMGAKADESLQCAEKRAQKARERQQRQRLAEERELVRKAEQRRRWPVMCLGQTHDLEEVARLRRVDYSGPWLAQALGHLRFCAWPPMDHRNHSPNDGPHRLMWAIGDRSCVQIRRLDGKEIPGAGKTKNLQGSVIHPIGLTTNDKPVIVTEGGPDYLAALARLWAIRMEDQYEVVCMLGSSQRFKSYAQPLKNREVTIYAHHDDQGQGLRAAREWSIEARQAGAASVQIIEPVEPGDLNDIAAL